MKKIYSFPRGGFIYEDAAVPSGAAAEHAYLPALSVVPLIQHTGEKAHPVVTAGETVKEGMLLGKGRGSGSANIHSPVPGRILRMVSWKTSQGRENEAFLIRLEGSFEKLGRRQQAYLADKLSNDELLRLIGEYGVVEMEAQGEPVFDIISSFRRSSRPVTLVVNCIFDDPWLAADHVLCRNNFKKVLEGSQIAARAVMAKRIIFAFSNNEKQLGEKYLSASEKGVIPSSLLIASSRYPQKNRRELEIIVSEYAQNEAFNPGILMILGPATLSAVHDAVIYRKPVLERYVAVGGAAVRNPQVMKVRIGTRIKEVFEQCGGFNTKPGFIAEGSPLLGRLVSNTDEPITKTSFAIYASKERQKTRKTQTSCINCGACRKVCPVGLDPEEIYKQIQKNISANNAHECHGCGCCEVMCPSRLPLSYAIRIHAIGGD